MKKIDWDAVIIYFQLFLIVIVVPAFIILGLWNAIDCWNRPIIEAPTRCISR